MSDIFKKSHIEPLNFSLFGKSCQIDILRDDLIHPIVSGNKWRKLKYILKYMINENKKILVTFGGAYSNHLVACSFAGKLFGIKTVAFVRGDEERPKNAFENLCIENGMQLIHVNREKYKDKNKLYADYFGENKEAEMVGEGGRHPLALIGCSEILEDIGNRKYDYILLSVGTGTTMEGIVKAIYNKEINTKVIGISSLKNNFELDRMISIYPDKYWQIEHNYHRGKYAKSDTQLKEFIDKFNQETSIQLEFVYTGKMMMALEELINNGTIESGKRILCIHTGGLPNLINI